MDEIKGIRKTSKKKKRDGGGHEKGWGGGNRESFLQVSGKGWKNKRKYCE